MCASTLKSVYELILSCFLFVHVCLFLTLVCLCLGVYVWLASASCHFLSLVVCFFVNIWSVPILRVFLLSAILGPNKGALRKMKTFDW